MRRSVYYSSTDPFHSKDTRILAWLVQLNIVIHFLIDRLFPCLPLQTLHFDSPHTRTSHVTSRHVTRAGVGYIARSWEPMRGRSVMTSQLHTCDDQSTYTFAYEVRMQHWTSYVSSVRDITVHWHYRENVLDCWISRSKACKNLEDFLENRDLVAQGSPVSHKSALHSNYIK